MQLIDYRLFVVFHQQLKNEYYDSSIINKYEFVNVNPRNDLTAINPDYIVISQYEFENFHSLGKWYTESEVIYNIYKNKYLYKDVNYIGFLQHDIDSSVLNKEILEKNLPKYQLINLQPYPFQTDYNQKILMDESQPDKKTGAGVNCYEVIINDYNNFYNTNYTAENLKNVTLNLCSSFILRTDIFEKMMLFIESIIKSGKLDQFDSNRQYRIQGGLLERYYAVWLAFDNLQTTQIPLKHHFEESVAQNSFFKRVINKLKLRK
ncbi:hypothetical protein [Mucilaginibacter sp. KACC 22063]|uniref:hypothetical protein n=1 Tax=Mucilaginibacter sp. KACC 22063 TaxID=3025666 RepID=UPI0023655AC9|nr:hypothetical protein [Mucilaginibacter sp. KACC 22063]WDF54709.1 hypothetical protein PQ461_17395 [Mucilaginibacter sp. KACC 22063]